MADAVSGVTAEEARRHYFMYGNITLKAGEAEVNMCGPMTYTPAPEPMGTAGLAERLNDLASRQGVRLAFFPLPDGYIRITSGGTAWVMKVPEGDLEVAADRAEGDGIAEWAREQVTRPFDVRRYGVQLGELAEACGKMVEHLVPPTREAMLIERMRDEELATAALLADVPVRAPRNRAERRAMARAR